MMPPSLTIGIDARAAVEVTAGRGRVVRELIRELERGDAEHHFVLYARKEWDLPLDERFSWRLIEKDDPWWHLATAKDANQRCDTFLSTNSYLTGWFLRIPYTLFVHDLIPFDAGAKPALRSTVIERITLRPALRRASRALTNSQTTRAELVERYPWVHPRTRIALLGASPTDLETDSPTPNQAIPAADFILAVGTLEPRKNLPRLVEAYSLLPNRLKSKHPLVVAGELGWDTSETTEALNSLGKDCIRTGRVSDADLAELFRRCSVFCYPSLGEGFGLPVLEAMSFGKPVVTSNISSMPEVGGDTAIYVDPLSPIGICEGLRLLLDDPTLRAELGAKAKQRAQGFTWESFASQTLSTIEESCQESR